MYCKKGNLARVVNSVAGNNDKIVRCMELWPHTVCENPDGSLEEGPSWVVDRALSAWDGSSSPIILDSMLRPIGNPRPEEIDEMVKRVGKPEAREVAA